MLSYDMTLIMPIFLYSAPTWPRCLMSLLTKFVRELDCILRHSFKKMPELRPELMLEMRLELTLDLSPDLSLSWVHNFRIEALVEA